MARRIPQNFLRTSDLLVNYDFSDVVTDSGYIITYALSDEENALTLIRQQLNSTDVYASVAAGGGGSGSVEKNFDYEFNIPQRVDGTLYVTLSFVTVGFSTTSATGHVDVRILHVNSTGTETEIAAQIVGDNDVSAGGSDRSGYRSTYAFDVTKQFKKGEKLRVEAIANISSGNANSTIYLYFDGLNRDLGDNDQHGTTLKTNLITYIPFRLDI